jgi:hypothetical protein
MIDRIEASAPVISALRAIRSDLAELRADVREVKERLDLLAGGFASLERRLARIGANVGQIRRCLDERPRAGAL